MSDATAMRDFPEETGNEALERVIAHATKPSAQVRMRVDDGDWEWQPGGELIRLVNGDEKHEVLIDCVVVGGDLV